MKKPSRREQARFKFADWHKRKVKERDDALRNQFVRPPLGFPFVPFMSYPLLDDYPTANTPAK